jgi:hypothetical protein
VLLFKSGEDRLGFSGFELDERRARQAAAVRFGERNRQLAFGIPNDQGGLLGGVLKGMQKRVAQIVGRRLDRGFRERGTHAQQANRKGLGAHSRLE